MSSFLALLSAGPGGLIALAVAGFAILGAVLGIRRKGVKAGAAAELKRAQDHVQRSAEQQAAADAAAARLPGDDARDRLHDKYGRP